ncbi:glutathione S-transferase [Maricurvus nonylphenolicus]|uniref:glutathione S-transferase family protein n=1 Tax=Maricurvus nonylphenolicus TaxID=1008307 RepID=UPI0036F3EF71
MITLHHLEYSQSFRVLWLLEELGVKYELKKYNRDPVTHQAPDEYKAVSPLGTAPVITDGDICLAETGAIIDYILDRHPNDQLNPKADSSDRTQHLFWLHASQGSMMPLMLMDSIFRIIQERVPALLNLIIRPVLNRTGDGFIKPRMEKLLIQAEQSLAKQDWFGGSHLTTADILLSYPIESANARGYITDAHPNTKAWLARIYSRPAFKSAKALDDRDTMVLPLG